MTHDELCAAGDLLFGEKLSHWKAPLARLLCMNLRTLERFASGQNDIPDWVATAVTGLVAATADIRKHRGLE